MSAAATAAGYLYASGRLRGRGGKEEGEADKPRERKVRVEVYQPQAAAPEASPEKPARRSRPT